MNDSTTQTKGMMIMVTITHDETMFKAYDDETGIGSLSYSIEGQTLSIHSIFVQPLYRGQGTAEKLTLAALEYTKTQQLYLHPICPYAVNYFEQHPITNLI
ncbi:MAG: GNAT family N-acetyltransferase [Culicoidibacterales bacterium]